jgi:hypothetical protein
LWTNIANITLHHGAIQNKYNSVLTKLYFLRHILTQFSHFLNSFTNNRFLGVFMSKFCKHVKFQVLMTATMKIYVFYNIMPCCLVESYWHFRGTCCPHLKCRNSGRWFIQNLTLCLPETVVSHPRRQQFNAHFLCPPLWRSLKIWTKIGFITIHELYYLAKKCSLSYITNNSSFYNTEINRTSTVLDNTIYLTSSTRLNY